MLFDATLTTTTFTLDAALLKPSRTDVVLSPTSIITRSTTCVSTELSMTAARLTPETQTGCIGGHWRACCGTGSGSDGAATEVERRQVSGASSGVVHIVRDAAPDHAAV
eukprot:CAMPEP_0175817308 /NCGR_PEP_ID=MMETSP0107_2-20121207/6944_1 /TAXON_ID=195067 ORGANISM="Goniomonas pacifica, Strain CCMP1869" /NCGR_SAMPLE_ID=MMETSP0107_2 /ASSEMBLY_ACC=CAM_ASM_000203 /LENGTH=108 /DNA_ID=CAMNT_0017129435 /DNA_START=215 /DNA_END=541 /DNA_ORIENTATION=-